MSRIDSNLKRGFTILAVILGALAFQVTGPAYAYSDILVDSEADNATGGDGLCTLREAINNANAGGDTTGGDCAAGSAPTVIHLMPDEAITLGSQLPTITSQVSVRPGPLNETAIIQAGTCDPVTRPGGCKPASFRLFTVASGGALEINDMTLRYGRCAGACPVMSKDGGAILNQGYLGMIGGAVVSNVATGFGGGIYTTGGIGTGGNFLLKDNRATLGGGAVASSSPSTTNSVSWACITGNSQPALMNMHANAIFAVENWWGSPDGPQAGDVSGNWDTSTWTTSTTVVCGGGAYNLSAATSGPTDLTFSWTDAATNEGGYMLQRSANGKIGWTQVASGTAGSTSLVDTAPACNTRYYYRVFAVDGSGNGSHSSVLRPATRVCAPKAVSPKNGAIVRDPDFLMKWKRVRGASGYHFQLSSDPDFSTIYGEQADNFEGIGFANLPFGVWYWHVASNDGNGDSAYGPTMSYEYTLNKAPKKNAVFKTGIVRFKWQMLEGETYLLRINDVTAGTVYYESPSPLSTSIYQVDKDAPLPSGSYSWQVSIDGGTTWTPAWGFTVQ